MSSVRGAAKLLDSGMAAQQRQAAWPVAVAVSWAMSRRNPRRDVCAFIDDVAGKAVIVRFRRLAGGDFDLFGQVLRRQTGPQSRQKWFLRSACGQSGY